MFFAISTALPFMGYIAIESIQKVTLFPSLLKCAALAISEPITVSLINSLQLKE